VQLFVDGYATACEPGPTDTLDDVLEAVRANNQRYKRAILGLACDGIDIVSDELNNYLTAPAHKFGRVDVQTGVPNMLIAHTLQEASRLLHTAEQERADVVDMFVRGKTGDAVILLGKCLSHWFQINQAISKSLSLIGIVPDAFEIDLQALSVALDPVSNKLSDVKNAVKSQDYVALADILEYEFNDVTSCWRGVIDRMLDHFGAAA